MPIEKWNSTRTEYPRDKTIHGLFEEQARRLPGRFCLRSRFPQAPGPLRGCLTHAAPVDTLVTRFPVGYQGNKSNIGQTSARRRGTIRAGGECAIEGIANRET